MKLLFVEQKKKKTEENKKKKINQTKKKTHTQTKKQKKMSYSINPLYLNKIFALESQAKLLFSAQITND